MSDMSSWSIKRVPLDFDWPVGYLWHGYVNPWPGPVECEECCGTGLNEASLRLYKNFKRWATRLSENEIALALKAGITKRDLSYVRRRLWDEVDQPLLQFCLTEIRAKNNKVWGFCLVCQGEQVVRNPNPAVRQLYSDVNLYDEWRPIEPPKGDGWQLWQVQDDAGSFPASSVFKSETQLAKWCSTYFKSDYASWLRWITKEGLKVPQEPQSFKLSSEHVTIFQQPAIKA